MTTDAPTRTGEDAPAPAREYVAPRWLRPPSVDAIVQLGLGVVALSLLAYSFGGIDSAPMLGALLLALAGGCYLAVFTSPSWLFSLGLAMTIFSGNSKEIGFPIAPDRILIASGLAAMVFGLPGYVKRRSLVLRPLHAVLAITAAIGTISAFSAGTLFEANGFFSLLDRLGLVPFLVFTLAPLIFSTKRDRNSLLVVLVGTGLYLGLVAVLEGTGNGAWAWPSYINDPTYGSHFGRARGPFAEPGGNGMTMYGCAVASAIAAFTWETRRSRIFAGIVMLLCLSGTIFTLTRSIWLATVVATVFSLAVTSRTRRALVPILAAGLVALVAALTFVPGFADQVSERQSSERPLWDRFNTNRAALSMVLEHPLTGIGWHSFEERAPEYLEVSDAYPLTGVGIPVHNVPLGHAAEMGVIGASAWLLGLALVIGAAILRPGYEELDPWRLGMVALFIHYTVVASFAPLGYAFPNLLLWTWAGITALSHTSRPYVPEEADAT
ncbi:MAG TPA: O-antigen ligase family protein [Gemmatimonadaceae bacterium]|nr:O-antigen ligase family protein [Gemmatimonadaceae bacterium]